MPEKETPEGKMRSEYQRRMLAIRDAFEAGAAGAATIAARAQAMDELIVGLWTRAAERSGVLRSGIALVALGGYGRSELFPYSDVDLMYLLDGKVQEKDVKQPIRRMSQELWDCGIRLSPLTRKPPGAEHQGLPGRAAGCACVRMVEDTWGSGCGNEAGGRGR
jgi:[protein-PII] uridylyltransferase